MTIQEEAVVPAEPVDRAAAPHPTPRPKQHLVDVPEPVGYRVKNRLLGPPLATERLAHERLGKPTALAVFASDCISSSAYASEEILRHLLPFIGIFAFSMLMPITASILIVLVFLILSYRETIKEYPTAGGAYIVTRDNWGLVPAQVAGVALLTDYILTVAVSVAAGAAALGSAFHGVAPFILPISVGFVLLIAAINLKGVKESGLIFAVPTYFFIVNMVLLAGVGFYKLATGGLTEHPMPAEGVIPVDGGIENVIFYGAGLWIVLSAFASGGAAVTGVEAISNGVPAFREPAWKNARDTLIIMGFVAGAMFFTVSFFAAKTHAFPFESGTPTVISQVGEFVYGSGSLGNVLYYGLQAGTMLILVLAANTSFADFPRLASFHAEDNFMPRQLTKRGHRLVFSNGILTLAAAAIFLLVVTDAQVDKLIPLYAIGVFLSFTLSQSGMAKHHLTKKEPGWQKGIVINGIGAVLSAVVCAIIAATKFTSGAWAIIVLIPILVVLLLRLNRQYEREAEVLAEDAAGVAQAPTVTRQVVIVMVDELDVASAKAIQFARSLNPDELLAVHFDLDPVRTEDLTRAWSRLGFDRLALDVVACPDRRLVRGAAEVVARQLLTPGTQVSVLLPRREYSRFWHRLVHDRTADSIAKTLSTLPQTNVTIVPFQVDAGPEDLVHLSLPAAVAETATTNGGTRSRKRAKRAAPADLSDMRVPDDRTPIADLTFRQRATVVGKVYSMRVQPWSGVASLELTVVDDTGALLVVFFGRRHLAGVNTGTRLVVKGTIGEHRSTMAMLNPRYDIQLPPGVGEPLPTHG